MKRRIVFSSFIEGSIGRIGYVDPKDLQNIEDLGETERIIVAFDVYQHEGPHRFADGAEGLAIHEVKQVFYWPGTTTTKPSAPAKEQS